MVENKFFLIKIFFLFLFLVILKDIYQTINVDAKESSSYKLIIDKPKNLLAKKTDKILPEPQASLLSGMLWGYEKTMSKDFYDALVRTGTLHVIALSGTNISILIALLAKATLNFGRRLSSLLSIIGIVLFIFFVGPSPTIIRAAFMGSLSMIAIYFGRQYWSLLSLFFVSSIMLFSKPEWLYSLSFQLSFLATLGIIIFATGAKSDVQLKKGSIKKLPQNVASKKNYRILMVNLLQRSFYKIKQVFILDLKITLSAQLLTLPVVLYNFRGLSLISPLTNVLVGFVVPPVTAFGIITSIIAAVFLPLGQIFAYFLWIPLTYFILIVKLTAKIPIGYLRF